VNADIFFIDWEKPRGQLFRSGPGAEATPVEAARPGTSGAAAGGHRLTPVSVWRTIFAANEWCELSSSRRTNPALTLVILLLIVEGGGLKYLATPQPDVRDLSPGPINPALNFANTIWWFAVITACQLAFAFFIGERYLYENPTTRFLDLCTVMKVSLLLMDQKYRGFYLHANAPHEHADGDMAEVAGHLYEEAAALRVGRGLPGCPDPLCQTFEVHVPALWRENYDRVFRRLLDSESAVVEAMGMKGGGLPSYAPSGSAPSDPALGAPGPLGALARSRERTRRLAAAQTALSTFLRGFVEETDPDFKRSWRTRTLLQAAFDFPEDLVSDGSGAQERVTMGGTVPGLGGSVHMYTDPSFKFERLVFRGIELDLALWDALLYCIVDWSLGCSPTAAALTTYVCTSALQWARRWLGQRAVAYKTLVDPRFLD
jgi:meckelin